MFETCENSNDCFVYTFDDIEMLLSDSKFTFFTLPVATGLNTFWFRKMLA